jgi:hypothetical protein
MTLQNPGSIDSLTVVNDIDESMNAVNLCKTLGMDHAGEATASRPSSPVIEEFNPSPGIVRPF